MAIDERSALLVVDVQNDFLPGGTLAVLEGDAIIPRLNEYIHLFSETGHPVLASRDWHPPVTTHFQTQGGPWPVHCVQNTPGAEFHPLLDMRPEVEVFSKGMGAAEDAYSAFQARNDAGVTLPERRRQLGVERVYVGGLTLDYCVQFTGLDALAAGLNATVLLDAPRAVNVHPHDAELAMEELVRSGAELATFETLLL